MGREAAGFFRYPIYSKTLGTVYLARAKASMCRYEV